MPTVHLQRVTMTKSNLLIPILCILLLTSCERTLYHSFHSVEGDWSSNDTIEFIVPVGTRHIDSCAADLELRCTAEFPYKVLWLYVEARQGDGSLLLSDTLDSTIIDDYGRQNGSTVGLLYQTRFPLPALKIAAEDTLRVIVSHLMDAPLAGVKDVGVRFSDYGRHQPSGN